MNDPQFVSLFHEYMQSLSDPKVREEEEAYLRQAEEEARQSGDHSFEFIFPKPSYVLELTEPGTRQLSKAEAAQFASKETDKNKNASTFINMCTSDKVELYREESPPSS
ncbi:hypothetical protein AGDE_15705 [Angomonas deanei]|uniref:Uncharacterized protein n=1 Tax=Angomonas deanei TaxID=59799 RepID=A0A7G2CR82_9TRYP|nr:hypothetical protein AGDE_15705 [Angomonas deanei]CAD2222326.1 hypothetical protein, conserved [Angomonas deanei]|eukprot:EPY18636.1 hypothetical protein AGDE_15705 [Angomonas deanei]